MNKETVLIVEDNHALREALGEILSYDGYVVVTALNGVDALEKMMVVNPDIILSDIAMPKMDGYTFFRSVRARAEWMSIPFIFLTARGERDDILKGKDLGAEDYLIKPLSQEELITAVRARLERSQQIRVATLRRAYESSLTVLANAIEARDPHTKGHVERVIAYAIILAGELRLQGRLLDQLRLGAILHDIGKIIVRENILFKADPLTPNEWVSIRTHPDAGAEMIKDIDYLAPIIPIIRYHHERWDGEGYPDGLKGDEISLLARILAVADSFDAMTIPKPYKGALSPDEAYQEVVQDAGVKFDPAVVAAFQRAWQAGTIQRVRTEWDGTPD
jgi:putative two-component system response regulator